MAPEQMAARPATNAPTPLLGRAFRSVAAGADQAAPVDGGTLAAIINKRS
jgi:hypothetical protein